MHEHTIPAGANVSGSREQLANLAAEAASAPAVKASVLGTGIVGIGDWVSTGPGLATAIGLLITVASFGVQVWRVRHERADAARRWAIEAREDARRQIEHEARMQALRSKP